MARADGGGGGVERGMTTKTMTSKPNAWDLVSADDPTDWTGGFSFMRALDATLRCELCYDIFTAPVSIKDCNHTFCSACVRSAINKPGEEMGSRCPRCMNKNVYDSSLIPQRSLEQAAQQWRLARPLLYAKQLYEQKQEREYDAKAKAAARKRPRSGSGSPPPSGISDAPASQAAGPSTSRTDKTSANGLRRSARSKSRRLPSVVVQDSSDEEAVEEPFDEADEDQTYKEMAGSSQTNEAATATKDYRSMEANDLLACPICQHTFTMRMLNVHLDKGACAMGDPEPSPQERGLPTKGPPLAAAKVEQDGVASTSSPGSGSWFKRPLNAQQSNGPPRKKLVRLNYDMVKPVDLKRALDEWRLPTTGERKRLVERHRYWVNLFNANLDASEKMRKSEAALRQELQAWERAQDEALRANGAFSVSEKRVKTWTQDHRDEFSRLAAQARRSHLRDRQKHDGEAAQTAAAEEKHDEHDGTEAKAEEAHDVV